MYNALSMLTKLCGHVATLKQLGDWIKSFAATRVDAILTSPNGSIYCIKGKPAAAICASMDVWGVFAKAINEDGTIKLGSHNAPSAHALMRNRIRFEGGAIGFVDALAKSHATDMNPNAITIDCLYADLGVTSAQEARDMVSIGQTAVVTGVTAKLAEGNIMTPYASLAPCAAMLLSMQGGADNMCYGFTVGQCSANELPKGINHFVQLTLNADCPIGKGFCYDSKQSGLKIECAQAFNAPACEAIAVLALPARHLGTTGEIVNEGDITSVSNHLARVVGRISFPALWERPKNWASVEAELIVKTVEQTHPRFCKEVPKEVGPWVQETVPKNYMAIRDAFLQDCRKQDLSLEEFFLLAQKYLACLCDAHTRLIDWQRVNHGYLALDWHCTDDKLYLNDGRQVKSIDGVPIEQIFAVIDRYCSMENHIARDNCHEQMARYLLILDKAGVEGYELLVQCPNGSIETVAVEPVDKLPRELCGFEPVIYTQRMGSALYIRLGTCVLATTALQNAWQQAQMDTRKAVDEGCSRYIIDVRGNRGGSETVYLPFLTITGVVSRNASTDELKCVGFYKRASYEQQLRDGPDDEDFFNTKWSCDSTPLERSRSMMAVLCDENTFSAAQDLCYASRSSAQMCCIGYPSANAPDCYINCIVKLMPYSQLRLHVSTNHMFVLGESTDPKVFTPDIFVSKGQNALPVALAWLNDIDKEATV